MPADNPAPPTPAINQDENNQAGDFFWQSGEDRQLKISWCQSCAHWLHPCREHCPDCGDTTSPKDVSGAATLVTFTINHHQWLPALPPPYVIGIVFPVEAPNVRFTTLIVDTELDSVSVGMSLEVDFIQRDDLWLPVFKGREGPKSKPPYAEPQPFESPAISSPAVINQNNFEHSVAFTGIGKSAIGRKLGRSQSSLTIEACRKAIANAGLKTEDIDGVCAYPGTSGPPGLSDGGVRELSYNLNLKPNWHLGAQELPGQTGTISAAMMAIHSGLCRHVLCFTSFSTQGRPLAAFSEKAIRGEPRWSLPYGCVSPANWVGMYANKYLQHFGLDRSLLANIAIAERKNASLNPEALYRNPMDLESYLSARPISTPFGLYDCDTPCDGAIAFVISNRDAANDGAQLPVYIDACGSKFAEIQSWDQGTFAYQPNVWSASRHLWSRTDFSPSDIDFAQLYDGFTFNVVCWLEALGFCQPGGAADFIGNGDAISTSGTFPINTDGGHLNAGRTNGYGHLYEAILQLRGNAGQRQLQNASTAVVSAGGGIPAGAYLLRNFC